MTSLLPSAGAVADELAREAHRWWTETALKAGIDLTGFRPDAPLPERLAWSKGRGLGVACVLSRFSSKLQHSTPSQIRDCVDYAGWHRLYPAPEYFCVDEAVSGRKSRRDGLDRARQILRQRLAQTLLVFKVSRLFRVAYKGYAFFQEEVVEEGLRAISVSQGIDTADEKTWKSLAYLHGIMDEMLLTAIADHVRSGLKSMFLAGYVTGALTVGYRAVEVPGAPPTNRGRPRTMPRVDPAAAALVRQHYQWVRDGMPLNTDWRRWVAAGGPCDPRSTLGHMSYTAYRRLLSNPRYAGLWAFGRKRNSWSSRRDYTRQILRPETEVALHRWEELRIVDDELFAAVQRRLADFKRGPRGPKKRQHVRLWDLTTEFFWCPQCAVRFYQAGAGGHGMRCKRGDLCPCKSAVARQVAVRAVCRKLTELLHQDLGLIEQVVVRAGQLDARGDEALRIEAEALEKKIVMVGNRINDLLDLVGLGTEPDRAATKNRLRVAQAQRARWECELARLSQAQAGNTETITSECVREIFADLGQVLEDAAAGHLGDDAVYKALAVFRHLTGGRVWVYVENRTGRKRPSVRGVFRPPLPRTVQRPGGAPPAAAGEPVPEVQVWLRPPPRLDLLGERVHQLMDIEGLSHRAAAAVLGREGYPVNSGNVWYIYRRYYAMRGLPVPKRPYNNGRPRGSA